MNRQRRISALAATGVIAVALAACTSPYQPAPVGADRDAHGCIGSAGYAWCAREAACVRPWELSAKQGFEQSEAAFKRYCQEPAK